jgi:hypothetical protein
LKGALIVMGLWADNYQEEDPWSHYHPILDQTIVVEAVDPVIHWVYGVVADVVRGKRPEGKVEIGRILALALVHMAGESLAESEVRGTLTAAVAAIADCRPKRPNRHEVVVGIHQDSGRVQRISYQTIWKESRWLGKWIVWQRMVVQA